MQSIKVRIDGQHRRLAVKAIVLGGLAVHKRVDNAQPTTRREYTITHIWSGQSLMTPNTYFPTRKSAINAMQQLNRLSWAHWEQWSAQQIESRAKENCGFAQSLGYLYHYHGMKSDLV